MVLAPLALLAIGKAASLNKRGAAYLGPPISWLLKRRVSWALDSRQFRIQDAAKSRSTYGQRYLDFKVLKNSSQGKWELYEDGSFNFWTTKRLTTLGILTQDHLFTFYNGIPTFPKESEFTCVIHDKFSQLNLYMVIHHARHSRTELTRLIERLRLVGP